MCSWVLLYCIVRAWAVMTGRAGAVFAISVLIRTFSMFEKGESELGNPIALCITPNRTLL
jgi:hypothetical protein